MGVLVMRALLCWVYVRALDFRKLSNRDHQQKQYVLFEGSHWADAGALLSP